MDLKTMYVSREHALYDSDNHYTGKPCKHFENIAIQQAQEDTYIVKNLVEKLAYQ
jgi:hypothetical protein